jgi:hypothetical protein
LPAWAAFEVAGFKHTHPDSSHIFLDAIPRTFGYAQQHMPFLSHITWQNTRLKTAGVFSKGTCIKGSLPAHPDCYGLS